MTEKIGLIKNPLTVIAIFAGIAEVSGTLVLPFISPTNQITFIYFLIIFPSLLVILFFGTLNFNNKALYAPSDFSNEENYIKIFKYDINKQENVEVKVSPDELLKMLNNNLLDFKNFQENKFQKIEMDLKDLKSRSKESEVENESKNEDEEEFNFEEIDYDDYTYEHREGLVTILNFSNAKSFIKKLDRRKYPTEIYEDYEGIVTNYKSNSAIWLGYKYPFTKAKEVILMAKEEFPHLSFIDYSNNVSKPPSYIHHQIFIGGATKTAIERGVKPLNTKDWEKLKKIDNALDFENFIISFQ